MKTYSVILELLLTQTEGENDFNKLSAEMQMQWRNWNNREMFKL